MDDEEALQVIFDDLVEDAYLPALLASHQHELQQNLPRNRHNPQN